MPETTAVSPAASQSSGKLRVVRVIARLNVGGPARHATTLNAELRAHNVGAVLVHGSVDLSEGSLEDLITQLDLRSAKIPELGRSISMWSDLRAFWSLTRLVFKEQPDVVHTHTAKAGTLGRLAALAYNATRRRSRRCVVVHTFHGHVLHGYFGPVGDRAVRTAERVLAAITDRIVTISRSQKHDICVRFSVAPESRTVVVELGLELDALLSLVPDNRLRTELGFDDEAIVFTFVGRLVPIKDMPTLFEAFRRLSATVPNARLVIAGSGELGEQLRRTVDAMQLADRVRFVGWRRDLETIYAGTDIGVLSSLNEGTPVALIETMAAGRPVVATSVGGVGDVVSHEVHGLLVPPRDPEAFAAAMERLARDVNARRRMGAQARRDVSQRYAPFRLASEINRLYRQALVEKRGLLPRERQE